MRTFPARSAVVVLGAIASIVLGACSDDDDDQVATETDPPAATVPGTTSSPASSAPTTTPPEPSTTAVVTSVPTTEPLVTTTTTEPVALEPEAWFAQCTERSGDPGAEHVAVPSVLGPLGARPGLEVTAPMLLEDGRETAPTLDVAPIPGGVLVMARSTAPEGGWMLAAIDDDASVRWRRCVADSYGVAVLVAPSALGPQTAYVLTSVDQTQPWRAVDLATGADAEPPAGLDGLTIVALSDRHVLLGTYDDTEVTPASAPMQLLDLSTGGVEPVPYPESANGTAAFELTFVIDEDDDTPVVSHVQPGAGTLAVFVDGSWQTDETAIVASAPDRVREDFAQQTLSSIDPLGSPAWTIAEFTSVPGEGFRWVETEGVVIANRCVQPSDVNVCDEGSMIGIDAATGEQLWQIAGFRAVSTYGDGVALITDEAGEGYVLIDVTTGDRVDAPLESSTWSGIDTFRTACCGEDAYVWVDRDGGVVFAVDNDVVRFWYPPSEEASQSLSASLLA